MDFKKKLIVPISQNQRRGTISNFKLLVQHCDIVQYNHDFQHTSHKFVPVRCFPPALLFCTLLQFDRTHYTFDRAQYQTYNWCAGTFLQYFYQVGITQSRSPQSLAIVCKKNYFISADRISQLTIHKQSFPRHFARTASGFFKSE